MTTWEALVLADQRQRYNLQRLLGLDDPAWPASFVRDHWPSGLAKGLRAAGVLVPGPARTRPICSGCELACAVEVEEHEDDDGVFLVGRCGEGVATGLLRFDLADLDAVRLDAGAVAARIAAGLGLAGEVGERAPGVVWRLGHRTFEGARRVVYLARGREPVPSAIDEDGAVVLATHAEPWAAVCDAAVMPLRRVVGVDGELTIDMEPIAATVERKKGKLTVTPVAVPPGATWKQVTVRFVDDLAVDIVVGTHRERRMVGDMGMADRRKGPNEPNEPWKLLRAMAGNGGRLTWSDGAASDKARWYVKQLRAALSALLPLEGSPIRDYAAGKGWVTAFTLVDGRRRDAGA